MMSPEEIVFALEVVNMVCNTVIIVFGIQGVASVISMFMMPGR